ncbi:hypothetical protein SODALDRAFT_354650 [Sodiomyces alkalinus F11]|uniref:Uncharacterized protein n=1 Tax=Sodiomyces alkalinus (strain CBS 110278 / VKM F-3762 / F11) TaxID=1314773 RepID=A0A3N2Q6X0_SODAK|nr:hypothetical protein SODALDRAFT_354650 [Sodiomyces alkalinus F11]ROT42492.1 hypothetical protein SODALDRAFT_354650 [Sodiomyces alkalinus F11]
MINGVVPSPTSLDAEGPTALRPMQGRKRARRPIQLSVFPHFIRHLSGSLTTRFGRSRDQYLTSHDS